MTDNTKKKLIVEDDSSISSNESKLDISVEKKNEQPQLDISPNILNINTSSSSEEIPSTSTQESINTEESSINTDLTEINLDRSFN